MKVYSLYYKDTFVVAFPNREDAIDYGKKYYDEYSWDCNILEEYLNRTPYQMYTPPYTTPNTIPCSSPNTTKLVHTAQPNDPKPYFDTYGGVKAEPYKDVSISWYGGYRDHLGL
jgi:hypothetical protein